MSNRSNNRQIITGFAIVALSAVALSGCASFKQRDAIEVGSVPDDYRSRHPIVIAEKQRVFQVPVAGQKGHLSKAMKSVTGAFLADYKNNGTGVVRIQTPAGTPNSGAASSVASQVAGIAKQVGVPHGNIVHENYHPSVEQAAPVRIIYTAMMAQTSECGRWSENILTNSENKQYKNFGCSNQANLAAQIADPADLLGPRTQGEVDTANRDSVIEAYRSETGAFESTIEY